MVRETAVVRWDPHSARCAFDDECPLIGSDSRGHCMIERAARELEATHLVVALDYTDAPSWRKLEYPDYKAHRTTQTAEWLIHGAAGNAPATSGWSVQMCPGYAADDIIATLALRAVQRSAVVVLSNDSDMLALTAAKIDVARPLTGSALQIFDAASVCQKYQIPTANVLYDFKRCVARRATTFLASLGSDRSARAACCANSATSRRSFTPGSGGYDKHSLLVRSRHADVARRALRLVSLRVDTPVPPISPASRSLRRSNGE